MSVLEASNLRDLLRVRDADDGRDALAGLTLSAVLGCESMPKRPSRTLLDIIKDEESGAAYKGLVPPPTDKFNKNTWKSFRSRLRVRRAGAAFSSSSSSHPCDFIVDECDLRISNPVLIERRGASRSVNLLTGRSPEELSLPESTTSNVANSVGPVNTSPSVQQEHRPGGGGGEIGASSVSEGRSASEMGFDNPAEETENAPNVGEATEGTVVGGPAGEAAAAPRVSLMALLEETDWNAGEIAGALEMEADEMEADEMEEDIGEEKNEDGVEHVCCVCMVRHKGAAFIPCGHTFCRLCSRELWVNRGNCPLCNNYILEILDIF